MRNRPTKPVPMSTPEEPTLEKSKRVVSFIPDNKDALRRFMGKIPQRIKDKRWQWDNMDKYGRSPQLVDQKTTSLPMEKVDVDSLGSPIEDGSDKVLRATPRSEVFHYSRLSPSKYLEAPLLHVGSAEQAATVDTYGSQSMFGRWYVPPNAHSFSGPDTEGVTPPSEREGITKFTISPEAKMYPETVSDEIANRAHAQYLTELGHEVPGDITYAYSRPSTEAVVNHRVKDVVKALHSGQLIPYVNTYEMERSQDWPVGSDKNSMSYVVPNPKKNLIR